MSHMRGDGSAQARCPVCGRDLPAMWRCHGEEIRLTLGGPKGGAAGEGGSEARALWLVAMTHFWF